MERLGWAIPGVREDAPVLAALLGVLAAALLL